MDVLNWNGNPSWALEGGEHYDGGWVPDCCGKVDYDPGFLRFSCRVYSDGDYTCSLYMGEDTTIEATGIVRAESKDAAKRAVEQWVDATAKKWASIILSAKETGNE